MPGTRRKLRMDLQPQRRLVAVLAGSVLDRLLHKTVAVVANNDRYRNRSAVYGLRRLQRSSCATPLLVFETRKQGKE